MSTVGVTGPKVLPDAQENVQEGTVYDSAEANGQPAAPRLVPMATVQTTAVNIICNILGGGLLVLPTAYDEMSVVPAIFITIVMGFFSACSFLFLILPAAKYQKFTYKDLLTTAFHRHAGKAFDGVLLFYTFGVLIEYAKIVAQAMPKASMDIAGQKEGVYSHEYFWLLCAFVPFWAFSSLKQLSHLRWTSYLGIVTIYYVVVLVIVRFFIGNYSNSPHSLVANDVRWFNFDIGFAKGFPILSVCYSCHYNIPPYYGEMKDRSVRKFRSAALIALPLITCTYVITGLLGYLMFGHAAIVASKGNVMQCFSNTDVASTVGQLGLFAHFCSVFPIVAMGTRRCINQLIFDTPWQRQWLYIFEAFLIVSSACVLAYFSSGVGIVVEIVGSLFSISIVYIIPAAVFLRLAGDRGPPLEPQGEGTQLVNGSQAEESEWRVLSQRAERWLRGLAWGFVIGGVIASVASFSITIDKIANNADASSTHVPTPVPSRGALTYPFP